LALDSFTALHYAIAHRHPDSALALLREGASIEAKTPKGLDALQLAWRFAQPGIVECIRQIAAENKRKPEEKGAFPFYLHLRFGLNQIRWPLRSKANLCQEAG